MSLKIIDTHPHVASHDNVRYPIKPLGEKRSDWSHERAVTTEELIAAMDEARVEKAALVHSSTTYGFACDYVADAIAAYPDRLTGVFSVNVLEPDATTKMREWFAQGLTGMRIYIKGRTVTQAWMSLEDPRLIAVYECAEELGITIALNAAAADGFEQLEAVLTKFPKVRFFLDHAGRGDFSGGRPFTAATPLLKLGKYPNLYLKVTSVNFLSKGKGWEQPIPVLNALVSEFGANRLAWGSNFPATVGTLTELVELAKIGFSGLSAKDQEWVFGGTALSLYPALQA
ncbi:MAG: amidohydrolase family protein [Acidocella sp.]|nr:amidohydrolase family protein [Acidocella sp.]